MKKLIKIALFIAAVCLFLLIPQMAEAQVVSRGHYVIGGEGLIWLFPAFGLAAICIKEREEKHE